MLLNNHTLFESSRAYEFVSRWFTEESLGLTFVSLGAMRLVGLFVNGARKDITPYIRWVSAGVGFMVYFYIAVNFVFSLQYIGLATALCIGPAVSELVNVTRASHDAKRYRMEALNKSK